MIDNNFIYCLDYTLDGYYNCENHGCNDEGICRCYTITDCKINQISIPKIAQKIFLDYFDTRSESYSRDQKLFGLIYNTDPLELPFFWQYVINRLLVLNKVYLKENWKSNWSSGYYGDELDSISIEDTLFKKLQTDLEKVIELNQIPQVVEYLLEKEYGYVIDKIKGKSYTIEEIDTFDLFFPQNNHHQKVLSKDLSYLDDKYFGNNSDDIQGVCIKEGNKYKVIDGYHRLTYFSKKNLKITIISIC